MIPALSWLRNRVVVYAHHALVGLEGEFGLALLALEGLLVAGARHREHIAEIRGVLRVAVGAGPLHRYMYMSSMYIALCHVGTRLVPVH